MVYHTKTYWVKNSSRFFIRSNVSAEIRWIKNMMPSDGAGSSLIVMWKLSYR